MTADPAAPRVPAAAPGPRPLPGWMRTRWGSWLTGVGGFITYCVSGMIVPQVALVVGFVLRTGRPPDLQDLIDYIPHLYAATITAALVIIGLLKLVGWLATPPSAGARLLWRILWVLGAGVACVGGNWGIAWLQTKLGFPMEEQEIIVRAAAKGGLGFLVTGILLAPLAEELVFRRFFFSTLRLGNGRAVAYAASACLFALIHFHPIGIFLYLWMAVCFTVAYERSGSIWGAIIVHVSNNALALLMLPAVR